jgi:serine/threonine protein kinase
MVSRQESLWVISNFTRITLLMNTQLVVKSYRAMDMNIRRLARVEMCGLIDHPHLASLRYIARTPESWLNYMDPGSATTTLTHYISSFHHNWSRVPPADRVDSGWWENWSCKVARQIGSALRYCYLQYISYGPLESDDVLVTNTGDVKLLGFDLVESQDISRDTQAFTTFTYGIIIWQMACGMPPWSQSENEEKFRNSPSSILARPSGMSPGK